MLTGEKICAPHGFEQLEAGVDYYFVCNSAESGNLVLARFEWQGKGTPHSYVMTMARERFEDAIEEKLLVLSGKDDVPPWLEPVANVDWDSVDARRKGAKKLYRDYVEKRYLFINPALDCRDSIFSSKDIELAINDFARRATPRQNELRFRLWFLTYLCFGEGKNVLAPPFHSNGRWNRDDDSVKKQGRPSKAFGKGHGYTMKSEMRSLCVKGYLSYVRKGKTMVDIYADTMTKLFGCSRIARSNGTKGFFHQDGKPFPTFGQFEYQIKQEIGVEIIHLNRYGRARKRRTLTPSMGRFSEDVAYLLEKVEFDGYYTRERPRGYLEGSALPALCVVTAREMMAGPKVGIGFSFGSERADAYRMALFSMAVPKDFFCALWGLSVTPDDWNTVGLAPYWKSDRGPASGQRLASSDEAQPTISGMTPSWSGQSKATVESSHPRDVHFEGEPEYILSSLTPVDLARREILRLIDYNHTADMSARMEMDPQLVNVLPSPHALWNHYASRLRTVGKSMSIPNAVREFLKKTSFSVRSDGVYLDARRYDSPELRESGLLGRVIRGAKGEARVDGYIMSLCLRHVWIEVDSRLLMLNAMLTTREDEDLLYVSMAEHEQWREARSVVKSAFVEHAAAWRAEMRDRFEQETGKSWDAGQRRAGRARKTAQSRQEASEVMQHTAARKSA